MHPTTFCPPPGRKATLPDRIARDNTVLLVIDCQVGSLWDLEFGPVRRRLADLAGSARRADVPVIACTIDFDDRGPVIPDLVAAHPGVSIINRSTSNAWSDDRIREAIRDTGRSTLVVAGAATDLCVSLCAMNAAADGLNVHAILEGPGDPPDRAVWFSDRLIVTSCDLVRASLDKRVSRASKVQPTLQHGARYGPIRTERTSRA
jgi:hypothetical protein